MSGRSYPTTPDRRYFVVRGRLWRTSNPSLEPDVRERLVKELMDARRAVGAARRKADHTGETVAHEAVNRAKVALGERGPIWWDDGAPDFNRHLVHTGPYAQWYASLPESERYAVRLWRGLSVRSKMTDTRPLVFSVER